MNVIVLGGGVIGLSAAVECAQRGMSVTVIDRSPMERGSSFGNAGMIVPSHFIPLAAPGMVALGLRWMWNPESPFYIKPRFDWELARWGWLFYRSASTQHVSMCAPLLRDLQLASRSLFVEMSRSKEFGLVEKGLAMLCKLPRTLEEESHTAERAKALGIPAEVLTAEEMAKLDPEIDMAIAGAVYFPQDCHLRPDQFVKAQEDRLVSLGGKLDYGNTVLGFDLQGNRILSVNTSEGKRSADEFLLCSGAWSSELARTLNLRIPMQAGKGYSVTLERPKQLPKICSILTEARVAVTPMGPTLRFGGTMEIAGLNSQISQRRVDGIIRSAVSYFPRFTVEDFRGTKPWYGLRPCSPDGMPYLGRPKSLSNLIIATGHAMMGLSMAPITGQIAAQIAADLPTDFDLRPLSPDRFA